jgi:hypothetical protein
MTEMMPRKGVQFALNDRALAWVQNALDEINEVYSDSEHDSAPREILLKLLELREGNPEAELMLEWSTSSDKYGEKVFTSLPFKNGQYDDELRVTLVLTKNGELRLDIRMWGVY